MTRRTRCFGRDDLIQRMLGAAAERRCVLLFGGRQAGKTTMLQHAENMAVARLRGTEEYGEEHLAVFVDLMALPLEAAPPEFYGYLAAQLERVRLRIAGGGGHPGKEAAPARAIGTTDAFAETCGTMIRGIPRVGRVSFLLDEAGRVLGRRFPRGFQDNLFSMLYVAPSTATEQVAFVFSGAQELSRFSEDETSPLGSRAQHLGLENLGYDALTEFVYERMGAASEDVVSHAFRETGGHAGLAMRFITQCVTVDSLGEEQLIAVSRQVADDARDLFRHWVDRLSAGARLALERLGAGPSALKRPELGQVLVEGGRDRFGADRVWRELQYVGICAEDSRGRLTPCARLFWRYCAEFDSPGDAGMREHKRDVLPSEIEVRNRIDETETTLRRLVWKKYDEKWPGRGERMMERVLGPEWKKVEERHEKKHSAYRFSQREVTVMDSMYLGELRNLILSNQAWELFRSVFGDRGTVETKIGETIPVRNDFAHPAPIPRKELWRCWIACDDMLTMMRPAPDDNQDTG